MELPIVSSKELEGCLFKNECIVIDIRSPKAYRMKHIKGAVCIPYDRLKSQQRIFKNRNIILYCDRGGLSLKAANELISIGIRAKSLVGGIESYEGRYLEYY